MCRRGEQLVEAPTDRGERARDGQRAPLDSGKSAGVEFHEPHRLAVPRPGERIRQWTAGVTQVLGQPLWPVEMAERHVVDAVEHGAGYLFDTTNRDRPF